MQVAVVVQLFLEEELREMEVMAVQLVSMDRQVLDNLVSVDRAARLTALAG